MLPSTAGEVMRWGGRWEKVGGGWLEGRKAIKHISLSCVKTPFLSSFQNVEENNGEEKTKKDTQETPSNCWKKSPIS
jgi:hypothetical protein